VVPVAQTAGPPIMTPGKPLRPIEHTTKLNAKLAWIALQKLWLY
jgi:hypothetical protein